MFRYFRFHKLRSLSPFDKFIELAPEAEMDLGQRVIRVHLFFIKIFTLFFVFTTVKGTFI
jgi:hypothetical protein